MKNIKQVFASFMKDESGQDLIEYALVAGKIGNAFNSVGSSLTNAMA
jgi:Flp pilus assembly pilin Flp